MSRLTARAVFLLLGCATAALVHAEEPATPPPFPTAPALTIEECVARALQKNFDLKIQSFSTDIARESLNIAKAEFEPAFNASFHRGLTQDSPVLGGSRNDFTDTRVGISQFVPTGALFNLSTSLDRNAGSFTSGTGRYTSGPFNPIYSNDVALSVSQPLLRGAGFAVNRAGIERTKLGIEIARLNFKSSVLQIVRNTEAAYYNLVFAREQLAVKKHSLALAERLYEENKTKKLAGVATDLDVLSAEVGIANARNGVVVAEQGVRNREDELLALIGQFEFDAPLGTVALLPYQEPSPSFDVSYKLARENEPAYLAAQANIKQLEIDARTAKNGALPTLDIGGGIGYNGTDRSYRGAVDRTSHNDAHDWQIDLTLSFPWGLHADRARYRSALANLRQQETRLQALDQDLLVDVRSAVRAVETNQQSVDITQKATELATRQYELELARFKAGLSTSRQVLQTQDDLETARVNELLARVNLRIAIANLHQIESSSLERYHIQLAE
jgi:outer membrane protein TolC